MIDLGLVVLFLALTFLLGIFPLKDADYPLASAYRRFDPSRPARFRASISTPSRSKGRPGSICTGSFRSGSAGSASTAAYRC